MPQFTITIKRGLDENLYPNKKDVLNGLIIFNAIIECIGKSDTIEEIQEKVNLLFFKMRRKNIDTKLQLYTDTNMNLFIYENDESIIEIHPV